MPANEFYIVVDIETSGPSPHNYAILSIGAATMEAPLRTFYVELQPDSPDFTDEAMQINNLSMNHLEQTGTPPQQAMQLFSEWIAEVTPSGLFPVFVAFNAPFDWMFINTYFHRYLSYNPFGHKALDLKALFMGIHGVPFLQTSHYHICQHYNQVSTLSHHALEDAMQEAVLLKRLLDEISMTKEEK